MTLVVPAEAEARLDWLDLVAALERGHARPRAALADTFLRRGEDTLLTRSAMIDGLGAAAKVATIFPGNPARRAGERQRGGRAALGRGRDA